MHCTQAVVSPLCGLLLTAVGLASGGCCSGPGAGDSEEWIQFVPLDMPKPGELRERRDLCVDHAFITGLVVTLRLYDIPFKYSTGTVYVPKRLCPEYVGEDVDMYESSFRMNLTGRAVVAGERSERWLEGIYGVVEDVDPPKENGS